MKCDSGAAVYEFFAGGGFARLGLAPVFKTIFANDIDRSKARAYQTAFGGGVMRESDVWSLTPHDLPSANGAPLLAWASFPCQDLSLAGARGGLSAPRSGAFWGFYALMRELAKAKRAPDILALENVCGLLTSHDGADFAALLAALTALGYRAGALEIDAALFVPQSRPRLFIVATRGTEPTQLTRSEPDARFHSPGLRAAVAKLPSAARARFVWWRLPAPPAPNARLIDVLESDVSGWNSEAQTARLLSMMSPLQRARVASIQASGRREAGALFRRIRVENGLRVQRAEARFDGLAGCLRTPAGGSSRQTLLLVDEGRVRSRLISPREAARLMGAPDEYPLPDRQSAALHLIGDAVCVPAVRWLCEHLLAPLAGVATCGDDMAAAAP